MFLYCVWLFKWLKIFENEPKEEHELIFLSDNLKIPIYLPQGLLFNKIQRVILGIAVCMQTISRTLRVVIHDKLPH